jgi:uncharacterized protein YbjT (DUF2867 family)
MDYTRPDDVILVTGATGNIGRQVVSQLRETGARIRALTRNPDHAGLPNDVHVVGGDLSSPDTLDRSLEGVTAVFLVCRPGTQKTMPALLDRFAKRARRIVFLSSAAVRDDLEEQTDPIGQMHIEIEHLIEKPGWEWTFLRPGSFATNAALWWGPQIREGNVVRWPYGAAAVAPIHERDIAAVAVRALTEDGHAGAKFVLTGPQALTQAEQVHTIGKAIGRPLHLEEIPPEVARQQMQALMPALIVEVLLEVWHRATTRPSLVTESVAKLTGAPAHTFFEWATDHSSDFRPAPGFRPPGLEQTAASTTRPANAER